MHFKNEKGYFLLVFFSFLLLLICLFPDVVFYGQSFGKRDILRFYYPVWRFAVETVKQGILPLWNPYLGYGAPFVANIQTCVFYPLTALLYLPNYLWAFNFYVLLHLALAGFFCTVWMRDVGASRPAAYLSGLAYALSGYVMSAISLTISLASLCYFPLALLSLRRAFGSPRFFWKGAASAVLLMQYLAGDPAVLFATLLTVTLFTAYKTFEASFAARRMIFKYALDLLKVTAAFLGLGAFHMLLFFEFLTRSNRFNVNFDSATTWSMQYNDLASIFIPYFSDISLAFMNYWTRQSWLESAYAGVTVILLAGSAAHLAGKRPLVRYHALLALFGVALALGRFTPLYVALYEYFPFFQFIRYPARFLFLFSFAAACLAGFGLDGLLSDLERRRGPDSARNALPAACFLLLLVGLVIVTMVYAPEIRARSLDGVRDWFGRWWKKEIDTALLTDLVVPVLANLKRMTVLVCLTGLGMLAARHFKLRRTLLVLFFTLLVSVDLVGANVFEVRLEGRLFGETGKNFSHVVEDKQLFRVLASPRSVNFQYEPPTGATLALTFNALQETLTPNYLLPYRVADVSGYDSIYLREAIAVNNERRNIADPTKHRFFDMLNIRYMVSPREEIGGAYRRVERSHPVNLFLNERVLPRAYLVPHAEVVEDRAEILRRMTRPDFDPEAVLYLDEPASKEEVPDPRPFPPAPIPDEVNVTEYSPNRVRMQVRSHRDQWLFFSDMHYPGWKAFLDGKPVKIHRANYAFRALRVGPGAHLLEWKYDPILFKIGCMVSVLTAFGLIGCAWRERRVCPRK